MKTTEFKKHLNRLLAEQRKQMEVHATERRRLGEQIMVTRMVADNIKDIVPKGWAMQVSSWGAHITLEPPEGTALDEVVKQAGKLAKKLNKEPTKSINRGEINITFYLYPTFMEKTMWRCSCAVGIYVNNTEACDIEVVEEMQPVKKIILTGYCKALVESKYLSHAD